MTNSGTEKTDGQTDAPTQGISDDLLPEDLQPSEDNPLAEPLAEEDAPDPGDLEMDGGKTADQHDDDEDPDGDDGDDGDTDGED